MDSLRTTRRPPPPISRAPRVRRPAGGSLHEHVPDLVLRDAAGPERRQHVVKEVGGGPFRQEHARQAPSAPVRAPHLGHRVTPTGRSHRWFIRPRTPPRRRIGHPSLYRARVGCATPFAWIRGGCRTQCRRTARGRPPLILGRHTRTCARPLALGVKRPPAAALPENSYRAFRRRARPWASCGDSEASRGGQDLRGEAGRAILRHKVVARCILAPVPCGETGGASGGCARLGAASVPPDCMTWPRAGLCWRMGGRGTTVWRPQRTTRTRQSATHP